MAGSLFDVHRAEPSQQQSAATPPLDVHRAESSQQHVRALNTQFASWVQAQLKNHPDEIWDNGVRDYLAHASNIMEKFSDVVKWLKTNAVKGGTAADSFGAEKKILPEVNGKKIIKTLMYSPRVKALDYSPRARVLDYSPTLRTQHFPLPIKALDCSPPVRALGVLSLIKVLDCSPTVRGLDYLLVIKSLDFFPAIKAQDCFPVLRPQPWLGVKTWLPQIITLRMTSMMSSDPADRDTWKDKGTGQLSIKCKEDVGKGTKESKPTIVVQNDGGRVLLNALLYPGIKTNTQKNSLVAIFHTAGDDGGNSDNVVARTFLIRTKTEEDRNKLATAILEYAPAS
uniref:RanBD1 domain-containing protein n=1 Tax=Manihot esculenta TaxID=3983 RepID=A0A2C9WIJ7_MANES